MLPRSVRLALAVALAGGCALVTSASDVVILKDGFVIQGNVSKETERIYDKATGRPFDIAKGNGFDLIDEGPKVMVFSKHARQLGEVSKDTKLRPDYKAYTMPFPGRKANNPLPNLGETLKTSEFNDKWVRTLTVRVPGAAPEPVEQQITHIDPYMIYMVSPTHRWRLTYRTAEWDHKTVRNLLVKHPDLAEPGGKCDPARRVALAKFMLDAGWLQAAKDEVDRLKRDFAGEMPKPAKDELEKLLKEIDQATAELVVREAELALRAGRYRYASDLLSVFPEKSAAPTEVARAGKVTAELKTSQERYDASRRFLRALTDEVTGMAGANALVGGAGGLAVVAWKPAKQPTDRQLALAAAAGQVHAELHQDSAARIETFVGLAIQDERERAQGKARTKTPEQLLATAVSGWARGKNGATSEPDAALRLWSAREAVMAYQRADTAAARAAVLGRFKTTYKVGVDELAQIISLLPPVDPEDLDERSGEAVPAGKGIPPGVYRRKSPPVPEHPGGVEYLVKLPPEYHHGRAYPVLIVLSHPSINPEQVIAPLAAEADKNGYILIAPEWTNEFGKGWEWRGEDHVYVTAALRDVVRRFTVDNDRVFLLGVGEGANMAMDVGMSHPDLFAGVVPVGPIPKWQNMFIHYWKNAQKLPFYVVTGEQAGESMKWMREIYKQWMPNGFPALMAVYKGRGVEWYTAEMPVIFDWMGRKKRVNGTATLQLGTGPRYRWNIMRETDNRFYWLEVNKVAPGNLIANLRPGGVVVPADIQADIRGNNLVDVHCRGVRQLTVWLSQDMIDWTKPVRVQINGTSVTGAKGKALEPNLDVLLDDYSARGDRRMLFLNKLEFNTIP
jgi:hypothetical protein